MTLVCEGQTYGGWVREANAGGWVYVLGQLSCPLLLTLQQWRNDFAAAKSDLRQGLADPSLTSADLEILVAQARALGFKREKLELAESRLQELQAQDLA
eukprot:5633350-Amphidinium_carterae.1